LEDENVLEFALWQTNPTEVEGSIPDLAGEYF
jgi:hypothetical protein